MWNLTRIKPHSDGVQSRNCVWELKTRPRKRKSALFLFDKIKLQGRRSANFFNLFILSKCRWNVIRHFLVDVENRSGIFAPSKTHTIKPCSGAYAFFFVFRTEENFTFCYKNSISVFSFKFHYFVLSFKFCFQTYSKMVVKGEEQWSR